MSAPADFLARERVAGLRARVGLDASNLWTSSATFLTVGRFAAGLLLAAAGLAFALGDFASDFFVFFMAIPAAGRGKARENFG